MNKARVEAFSDGMFTILGTLLVLEISVPDLSHVTSLASFFTAMQPVVPKLFVFALSFIEITSFWINHTFIFREVKQVDWATLIYNSLMMLSLSLLPFSTSMLGSYFTLPYAFAFYNSVLLLISIWFSLLTNHINHFNFSTKEKWVSGVSLPLSGGAQFVAIILALLHLQYWGLGLILVMVVYYVLPPHFREHLIAKARK